MRSVHGSYILKARCLRAVIKNKTFSGKGSAMLILTRKSGEKIAIGDDIVINFLEIKGTQVKVGVEAPRHVTIHRQEVYERVKEENKAASSMSATDLSIASEFYSHINTRKEKET